MERMKDLTQQYVEQLENMVKDLREEKFGLEEENKKLKDNIEFLHSCLDDRDKSIAIMQEENEKLKDGLMLRLAEAYLLPPTSNQMAEYKQWNYSKWYDEIKNQMRKEIKEED